jgi:dipeptidyl aminopeptidase/acylaminoacyl peptidase
MLAPRNIVLRCLLAVVFATALLGVAASAEAAFPGPNGKIAFASNRSDAFNFEVYVMNSDGTGVTQLTNSPGSERQPAWSPDGQKIVFSSERDGIFAGPMAPAPKIYVMNADGSGQTRLTSGTTVDVSPSWSADGSKIVFSRAERTCTPTPDGGQVCEFPYQLYVMNGDGSGLTQITNNGAQNLGPVWSPDGQKIAFGSSRPGYDVYSINPDGSAEASLTTDPAVDEYPDWSPDGGKIAFDRGLADIYVMNADGSQQTLLQSNGVTPAWSPNGRRIVFTVLNGNDAEIYVANVDGSGRTDISNDPALDLAPDWQPRVGNAPPDCSAVKATPDTLRPPKPHKLVPVTLSGATDPDGDEVSLTVTGVTQDEPLTGQGDNTSPDATSAPAHDQVNLRGERSPGGDGRVYRIAFTASDGAGGTCSGTSTVGVPRYPSSPAVDSAPPSYDSFGS